MARMTDAELATRLRETAAPHVDGLGLDLEDVELRGHQGSRKVRLVVHADDGLDIDVIARLSREVGAELDEQDVVPGSYTLEVTSPGADRPLRRARDFDRNIGREVRVLRREDVEGDRETTGTITDVDDEQITLEADGDVVHISLGDVDHGKVVLPW